jgi:pantoate--beta-alanine ligase
MKSELVRTIAAIRDRLVLSRLHARTIGLVPTMGALHAGHGALIERARGECNTVVVSIFVNPIQFDRTDDYDAYAIDLTQDLEYCSQLGADLVFAPSPDEMYPSPPSTFVEVAGVSEPLCGKFRLGHFRGVATVVAKLLNIVGPDKAYFGQKDAQQLAVIQRMVGDLNMPVEIVPVPTVREPDGLALSSRNRRLTPEERRIAPVLYEALCIAADCIWQGSTPEKAKEFALARLRQRPQILVEYLEIVDPASMTPVERISGPVRIAIAAWIGSTRLIDNIAAAPEKPPD